MAFLRNFFATLTGLFVFSIIVVILFLLIIGGIASSGDQIPTVKNNTVLHLNMSGMIQERVTEDPLQELLLENGPKPIGLRNILDVLDAAKADDRVSGIYMTNNFLQAGYASLSEIRDALLNFKESGKFIYSYGTYMSEGDYYLASVADSIFLNPEGSLELNGLSANITFFKGAFEKLGVEPEIFRVGKYKSFVEPYIRKDMSEENRYQTKALLSSLYNVYTDDVSASLGKSKEEVNKASNEMLIRLPIDAEKNNYITRLAYEDEVKSLIKDQLNIDDNKKINFMSHSNYFKAAGSRYNTFGDDQIAVIVAEGDIVMGSGSTGIAGDRFAKEIRKARENKKVKAVVIRINSGGGSLTASDIMWREIMLTKKVKPVIASMGDVAASGGYFMAMPCDAIVARPNTITGSIGIFGMMFNLENMLEDKIGITHDVVNTGEYSDIVTVTRALTAQEKAIIQQGVDKGYETFITKAAEGRGMTKEAVLEVASGRVWTGTQALEVKLIDELGGLDRAISLAAEKAGLESENFAVNYFPQQKPLLERFLNDMGTDVKTKIADEQYGDLAPFIKKLKNIRHYQGIQARLPYQLEIN